MEEIVNPAAMLTIHGEDGLLHVLQQGFTVIKGLFNQFDGDKCGAVPFLQLKAGLKARGLVDTAKFVKLWHTIIDKDRNGKADIGEFLVVVYFWQFRDLGTYLDLFEKHVSNADLVKGAMEELDRHYRKFDADHNGHLSKAELTKLLEDALPNVKLESALAAFSDKKPEISFSQFMRFLFTSLTDQGLMPPQADGDADATAANTQLWKQLVELCTVLEEDYGVLGQGSTVTLQQLLSPVEHVLQPYAGYWVLSWLTRCCICDSRATHCCANPACSFNVCEECFKNVQSHVVDLKGPGGELATTFIRANFRKVDTSGSGSLDFFEFILFAFLCCEGISYSAICPNSKSASAVKAGMMSVQAAFRSHDTGSNDRLTWAQVSSFFQQHLGKVPEDAQTTYSQLAEANQSITMKGFFTLLYRVACPNGKYLLQMPAKKPVQEPRIAIAPDSCTRPQIPILSLRRPQQHPLGEGGRARWTDHCVPGDL
eukprot:GGOE01009596.1.p1 GENE.GGOE01009596.1~~GGOE01009596.1.p1  ORF type:complete len:483 (-),score=113.86 GGOE01009596.1:876-2324(-)